MSTVENMLPPIQEWAGGRLKRIKYPVKVLQIGEGNFLRAFADWMIDIMNEKGLFKGSIRIIQPRPGGNVELLNKQNGLYTVVSRGLSEGKAVSSTRIVGSIERGVNPYADYDEFIESARLDQLRFVISNTTEAGISYKAEPFSADKAVLSFPGKIAQLLFERFRHFDGAPEKGLVFLPCELIERNGDTLKKLVLRLCEEWELPQAFLRWVDEHNIFTNTLVDRIVPGFPSGEAGQLYRSFGYTDRLVATCENFHLWVIEGGKNIENELPFSRAGLNVIWTDDLTPYRTRKVRILNGIHTMTCTAAVLYGLKTVKDCLEDPVVSSFITKGLEQDILPSLSTLEEDPRRYAGDVLERFANPSIQHSLIGISLNSVAKFKTRVLPGMIDQLTRAGRIPEYLVFSLASLIVFYDAEKTGDSYHGDSDSGRYEIKDSPQNIDFFINAWSAFTGGIKSAETLSVAVLSNRDFWGEDLNHYKGLSAAVGRYIYSIREQGIKNTMKSLTKGDER